jgi:ketosteroid isomerase-like protein
MGAESVEVVRGVYEAFGRGDVGAVLGAMTDDVEWSEAEGMPYGGVYRGGNAIAQSVLVPITTDLADFSVTPEEFLLSGDTVATVVR